MGSGSRAFVQLRHHSAPDARFGGLAKGRPSSRSRGTWVVNVRPGGPTMPEAGTGDRAKIVDEVSAMK